MTRIPETIQGLSLDTEADLWTVFESSAQFGYLATITRYELAGEIGAYLDLTDDTGTQRASLGDWAVLEGTRVIKLLTLQALVAAGFTGDLPTSWAATQVAPLAVAGPGGTATLKFPPPTSPNGPFTYGLAAGSGTFGAQTADTAGNLVFPISGLTPGQQYSWTVTAATQYTDQATVTALPSNTITAE